VKQVLEEMVEAERRGELRRRKEGREAAARRRMGADERLRLAVWSGDVSGVCSALDDGASVELVVGNEGERALDVSVERGDVGCAQVLLDRGARVDGRGSFNETLLHRAARGRNAEMVKVLERGGVDVLAEDLGGRTALQAFYEASPGARLGDPMARELERAEARAAGEGRSQRRGGVR